MIPVAHSAITITLIPTFFVPVVKRAYTVVPPKYVSKTTTSISKNFPMNLTTLLSNNNSVNPELSMD